jgi:hypothetical protein
MVILPNSMIPELLQSGLSKEIPSTNKKMIDYNVIVWPNGTKEWYLNGKHHREDGPAIELANGTKDWYLNGKKLTEKEHQDQTSRCTNKVIEIDGKKYKLVEV